MNKYMRHRSAQAGTTMIEVLVSILVVSIGLLGLAGLFANSLKSTNEGYMYSQVVSLTYDIAERMRANPGALASYSGGVPAQLAKDCTQAICTPDEMAAYDLFTWKQQLDAALSNPVPAITVNGNTAVIELEWDVAGAEIKNKKKPNPNKKKTGFYFKYEVTL